ncbi:MAG: hypothetical protein KatS3mg130_1369 [Candidatus Sumerlaea sp.]|nr:MAG: hypothetical protein KatS3mg130_1369 [Candidatus Sumerlaea sp.]
MTQFAMWKERIERLLWLLVMALVAGTALVYPLRLPDFYLGKLDLMGIRGGVLGKIYLEQLRPELAFNHSPLVYKETVAAAISLAIIAFYSVYIAITIGLHRQDTHFDRPTSWREAVRSYISHPGVAGGLFLVFAAAGVLLVSPTVHYSLRTLFLVAMGVVVFSVVVALRPNVHRVWECVCLVIVVGAIVAFVSFLQHVGLAWWFLPNFEDPRNRVGSLIGHNTGLSSFLLFPLGFALPVVFLARRWLYRLAAALTVVLILFVIVAAQSRAIWILGALMVAGEGTWIARLHGYRLRLVHGLAGVLAAILMVALVQSVAPTVNPLARHAVPLTERIRRDFRPAQLLKETRLRIFVVSLPLIAKSPLWGHGLGSFQYVYPPAHGAYFLKHPDSVLGTTAKRTDLAHNDYLQLVVECGFVGFALAGWAVWLIARRIRTNYRIPMPKQEKMLLGGMVWPFGAVMIHAFFDFPFHVAPIGFLAVVTAGVAYAFPRANGQTEQVQTNDSPAGIQPRIGLRWNRVGALVAVAATWLLVPLGYEFFLRDFVADILTSDASKWAMTARQLPPSESAAKYAAATRARDLARKATKLSPLNGEALEALSHAFSLLGQFDYLQWRALQAAGQTKEAENARLSAFRNYGSAINHATNLVEKGELRYHYIFYLIGQAYHMLWRLQPDVYNYLLSAKRALEGAISLNNADVASLFELAEVYNHLNPPDNERAAAMRRRIFEVDPDFGESQYLVPLLEMAMRGNFASAWKALGLLNEAVGDHWSVRLTKARLYLMEALWPPPELDVQTTSPQRREWFQTRYRLGRPIIEALLQEKPRAEIVQRAAMLYFAAGEETTRALAIADRLLPIVGRDPELDVLRYELARRAGQKRALLYVQEGSAEFWYYRQRLRLLVFGETALGAGQLGNLARERKIQLRLDEGLRAAAYLQAARQWDYVATITWNLLRQHPNDPDVSRYRARALQELEKAKQ